MERRIHGKRYNTETATELASWQASDEGRVRVLARRDADVFLHIREYGFERIEPSSWPAAWDMIDRRAKETGDDQRMQAFSLFGKIAEKAQGKTVTSQLKLSPQASSRLATLANLEGITKSEYVERLIMSASFLPSKQPPAGNNQ